MYTASKLISRFSSSGLLPLINTSSRLSTSTSLTTSSYAYNNHGISSRIDTIRNIFFSSFAHISTNYKPIKDDEIFSEIIESKKYESKGNFEASISVLKRAKDMVERTLGKKHDITLNILFRLINAEMAVGELKVAQNLCTQVLERIDKSMGKYQVYAYPSLYNLITCYQYTGDLGTAVTLCDQLIDIARSKEDWVVVIGSMLNKAIILSLGCRDDESREMFEETIKEMELRLTKEKNIDLFVTVYGNYACYLHSIEIDVNAEQYYLKSIEMAKSNLGNTNAVSSGVKNTCDKELVHILTNYCEFLLDTLRYDDAEKWVKEASELAEKVHGRSSPKLASVIYLMARLYREKENHYWAEGFFSKCITIFEDYRSAKSIEDSKKIKMINEDTPQFEPGQREIELRMKKEVEIEYGSVLWEYAQMLREKGRTSEAIGIEERARKLNAIDDKEDDGVIRD